MQNYIKEKASRAKLRIDWDNSVLFMLACDYNNAGDLLIMKAQSEFIKKHAHNKKLIIIPLSQTTKYLKNISKNATSKTIIALTGGGNTDDRYTSMERARNQIIKRLAKNGSRIIGFPQTVAYSNTPRGRFYSRKAQEAYSRNDNFVFFAREKISFSTAKKLFTNRVELSPDIVLSYTPHGSNARKRRGIGALLRKDGEKALGISEQKNLLDLISENYGPVEINDMTSDGFSCEKINSIIDEKIRFVRSKEVIVTDRLHGMILCCITGTPCVVLSNSNHKIRSTFYDWLSSEISYIKYYDELDYGKIINDIRTLRRKDINIFPKLNYSNLAKYLQQDVEK